VKTEVPAPVKSAGAAKVVGRVDVSANAAAAPVSAPTEHAAPQSS